MHNHMHNNRIPIRAHRNSAHDNDRHDPLVGISIGARDSVVIGVHTRHCNNTPNNTPSQYA